MTEEEATTKVAEAMKTPDACAKAVRAATGMGIHFETLGWTAEQYRQEILRLRLELASVEEDLRDLRDFDV